MIVITNQIEITNDRKYIGSAAGIGIAIAWMLNKWQRRNKKCDEHGHHQFLKNKWWLSSWQHVVVNANQIWNTSDRSIYAVAPALAMTMTGESLVINSNQKEQIVCFDSAILEMKRASLLMMINLKWTLFPFESLFSNDRRRTKWWMSPCYRLLSNHDWSLVKQLVS